MSDVPEKIWLDGGRLVDIRSIKDYSKLIRFIRHDLHTTAIKELIDELKKWRGSVHRATPRTDRLIKKYGCE